MSKLKEYLLNEQEATELAQAIFHLEERISKPIAKMAIQVKEMRKTLKAIRGKELSKLEKDLKAVSKEADSIAKLLR